jgi:hypothetical protein
MHKPGWTPSIVPAADDETIYLVAEDFGKLGRAWRELIMTPQTWKPLFRISSQASITIQSARLLSTHKSDAPRTFPKTWPTSCAADAISRCVSFLPRSLILWNSMKAMFGAS